jgi:hypothetical protein
MTRMIQQRHGRTDFSTMHNCCFNIFYGYVPRAGLPMRRRDFIAGLGLSAVLPRLTQAQQAGRMPLVAILWHGGSPQEEGVLYDAMKAGFTTLGYVAGNNVIFEERFPGETPGQFERFAYNVILEVSETRIAADKLGLAFDAFEAKQPEELDRVFSTIV